MQVSASFARVDGQAASGSQTTSRISTGSDVRDMSADVQGKNPGRWLNKPDINVAKQLKGKSDDHETGLAVDPGYNEPDEIGRWKRLGRRDQRVVAEVIVGRPCKSTAEANVQEVRACGGRRAGCRRERARCGWRRGQALYGRWTTVQISCHRTRDAGRLRRPWVSSTHSVPLPCARPSLLSQPAPLIVALASLLSSLAVPARAA